MGNTFIVYAWVRTKTRGYVNEQVYSGESLIKAIRAMRQAKRSSGCVRLEWR